MTETTYSRETLENYVIATLVNVRAEGMTRDEVIKLVEEIYPTKEASESLYGFKPTGKLFTNKKTGEKVYVPNDTKKN